MGLGFKVFFIGFNKCATRSFTSLFRGAGLNPYHGGDADPLYYQIPRNIAAGRKPLEGFEDYDAYSDSQRLSFRFRDIDRGYPNSKFVLNTRDVNRWIVSRLNHGDGTYVEYMNEAKNKNLTWDEWVSVWRLQFIEHERQVTTYFQGRSESFLRYDIETDSLANFNKFIGVELAPDGVELPHHGLTMQKFFALDGDRIIKL